MIQREKSSTKTKDYKEVSPSKVVCIDNHANIQRK
jgi:hypothetical protein